MKKVQATGRTLEEALQIAARQLGVGVDVVDYELVEEGTKGFLGLGQTPTVVSAWVAEDRRPAPRPQEPEQIEEEESPEPELEEQEPEEEEPDEQEPEVSTQVDKTEPAAPVTETVTEETVTAEPAVAQPAVENVQAAADLAMKMLTDVTGAMDVDGRPELRSAENDEIQIELIGKDVALLIGKRGQTIDALQYLTSLVANRGLGMKYRVVLDAEGYRARHQQMLEHKALEYARAVAAEGKEAVLEPQPARDRRIVHLALAEHPDVYTYSEGEGDDRHVVISPKR